MTAFLAGTIIFAGAGTILVKAADGPDVMRVVRHIVRAEPDSMPTAPGRPPIPAIFQIRNAPPPARAIGYAPATRGFSAPPRASLEPLIVLPQGTFFPRDAAKVGAPTDKPLRARQKLAQKADNEAGLSVATNYCVRLCDGYAFPVGHASGNRGMQEDSCRRACPGADTALYSAPAGAKDFDSLARDGAPYTALPNAFRYREKITNACTCHAPGATQPVSAVLTDLTLKRGDLVMTRIGARHFDGSRTLPHRSTHFSDALARLTNKREIAIVRAMEVASVRGELSRHAAPEVRQRIVREIREAEKQALKTAAAVRPTGVPHGFVELQAREKAGPVHLQTVKRAPGLVAMN